MVGLCIRSVLARPCRARLPILLLRDPSARVRTQGHERRPAGGAHHGAGASGQVSADVLPSACSRLVFARHSSSFIASIRYAGHAGAVGDGTIWNATVAIAAFAVRGAPALGSTVAASV